MHKTRTEWDAYIEREKAALVPVLERLGYRLESSQPHISGERFLFRAVTTASGAKLILLGQTADGRRVVIKATRDAEGARELIHERECRRMLKDIDFAYELFTSPEELLFTRADGFVISVQAFIEQEFAFLDRPLKEQFAYALGAFKAQEGAHATTYEHRRKIRGTFGSMNADGYRAAYDSFRAETARLLGDHSDAVSVMHEGARFLSEHLDVVEQYGSFLTHTDFVPHNFRIKDGQIYLLDYASLRFGNKYEGWARFLNFMALHNPPLADALTTYVRENRTEEESEALAAMRAYRLGEIITYYARNVSRTDGDLRKLTEARVAFWTDMLREHLEGRTLPPERIKQYETLRDSLRSEEEKARQVGLH
jgi:hypothetical protein